MTEISFRFNSCRDETSFYNNQVGKIAESAESNDNEGRNASVVNFVSKCLQFKLDQYCLGTTFPGTAVIGRIMGLPKYRKMGPTKLLCTIYEANMILTKKITLL